MKLLCALVVSVALVVCAVPIPKWPNTGTFIYNFNITDKNLTFPSTWYWDTQNQRIRYEGTNPNYSKGQPLFSVLIADYKTQIVHQFGKIGDEPLGCMRASTSAFPNFFTRPYFSNAKYAGLATKNGKVVNVWQNVSTWEGDTTPFCLDVFTGDLVSFYSSTTNVDMSITTVNHDVPPADLFVVPKYLDDTCVPASYTKLHPIWLR